MRFVVYVDLQWRVTVTCDSDRETWERPAPLRRLPDDGQANTDHFPLPRQTN